MVGLIAPAVGLIAGALSERYSVGPSYTDFNQLTIEDDFIMETRAFFLAQEYLIEEEGYRNGVYKDSRGILTVGIGHKVLPGDNLKMGDVISDARVQELFQQDCSKAFEAALSQAKQLDKYNEIMIARLTSVNFQLGTGWRTKFPNTWSMLKNGDVQGAINNLTKSAWYKQTPSRVTAFVNTLQAQFA